MWVVRVPRTRHTVGRFVASAAGAGPAPAASLPPFARARSVWPASSVVRWSHTVGRLAPSASSSASMPVPVRARAMWGATAGPRPSSGASAAAVAPLSARPSGYRPHRHWHAHGWR